MKLAATGRELAEKVAAERRLSHNEPVGMARRAIGVGGVVLATAGMSVMSCTSFDEVATPPDAGEERFARSDDGDVDAADADSGPAVLVPYCKGRDATFCVDFPFPPVENGFDGVANPTTGLLAWTEAGASEPGAARFTTGPVAAGVPTAGVYLERLLVNATSRQSRAELSVRFDEAPDVGKTTVLALFLGNVIFYVEYSQLGYAVYHGYYPPICDSGPCAGGFVQGTKAPIPRGAWDHLTLAIVPDVGGGAWRWSFDTTSGEHIEAKAPAGYQHVVSNGYFRVGFVILAGGGDAGRLLHLDDVSFTAE